MNMLALTKKQILIGIALFFVGLATPIGLVSVTKIIAPKSTAAIPPIPSPNQNPATPLSNNHTATILFLGHGGDGHPGGYLADAIILAHINTESKQVALIAIPRDLWVPINSEHHKINQAFALGNTDNKDIHGGGKLTKQVLKEVAGLDIDYYISVNFEGFKQSIDLLGGVTVDVPVTFTDNFYPVPGQEANICGKTPTEMVRIHKLYSGFELEKQFECRYERLHFDAGPTLMDGNLALKFIRSRHSEEHGGDFARGEREQALLIGIKNKVLSLNNLDKAIPFAQKFAFAIRTDIDEDILTTLLNLAGNLNDYQITNLNLTTDNLLENSQSQDGQYILIPKAGVDNWDAIKSYVHEKL